jgi:hypothetical protein
MKMASLWMRKHGKAGARDENMLRWWDWLSLKIACVRLALAAGVKLQLTPIERILMLVS